MTITRKQIREALERGRQDWDRAHERGVRATGGKAMSETCTQCGRPRAEESDSIFADVCFLAGSVACELTAIAWRRGLREGVDLAESRGSWREIGGLVVGLDFTEVRAELARRVGGGE